MPISYKKPCNTFHLFYDSGKFNESYLLCPGPSGNQLLIISGWNNPIIRKVESPTRSPVKFIVKFRFVSVKIYDVE